MSGFLQFTSIFSVIWIGLLFTLNLFKKTWPLMGWRNLFLIGYAYFLCVGAYLTVTTDQWDARFVAGENGWRLLALSHLVFLPAFLLSGSVGAKMSWVAKLIPPINAPVTSPAILLSIGTLLGLALFFAVVPPTSYLGLLAFQFRSGMAAAAAGLAVFYFFSQRLNPMTWWILIGSVALALLISTVGGGNRRFALGVMIMVTWMWWHFQARHKSAFLFAATMIPVAVGAFMLLFIYSSVRHHGKDPGVRSVGIETRLQQFGDLIENPQMSEEVLNTMLYTDTSNNTMFIMETYPDSFDHMPLHGPFWLVTNPIPRFIWPDKPEALGVIIQEQMGTAANLGPGIIGHGWSELGWTGVIYYAVFFGVLTGVIDRSIRDRNDNPYYLAVLAAAAGNVFAIPRGDTPLFLIQTGAAMFATYGVLYGIKIAFGPVLEAFPTIEPAAVKNANREAFGEYDGYADYEMDHPEFASSYHDDSHHDDAGLPHPALAPRDPT